MGGEWLPRRAIALAFLFCFIALHADSMDAVAQPAIPVRWFRPLNSPIPESRVRPSQIIAPTDDTLLVVGRFDGNLTFGIDKGSYGTMVKSPNFADDGFLMLTDAETGVFLSAIQLEFSSNAELRLPTSTRSGPQTEVRCALSLCCLLRRDGTPACALSSNNLDAPAAMPAPIIRQADVPLLVLFFGPGNLRVTHFPSGETLADESFGDGPAAIALKCVQVLPK